MRRRVLIPLLIAATGLLLLLVALLREPVTDDSLQAAPSLKAARTAASAAPNPFWDLAAQASARADSADAGTPMDLERWEADWCRKQDKQTSQLDAEQLRRWVEDADFQRISVNLAAQLRARLQAMRNPRADAALDWLEDTAAARGRLLAHARRSGDAFVLALALQHACTNAACQRELARRWQQLEPQNLNAYLWELHPQDASAVPAVLAGIAQAGNSKSYVYELLDLLRDPSRPPSKGPLALLAEMELMERLEARKNSLHPFVLGSSCREAGPTGGIAPLCANAAEKLWTLNQESILLAMVSNVMAMAQTSPAPHWKERRQLTELSRALLPFALGEQAALQRTKHALRCQPQEPDIAQQLMREPEWLVLQRAVLKQRAASAP